MSEPRQGPRPLALHLATHAATMSGSCAALPLLRNGSLPWKPHLAQAAASLRESLASVDPEAFQKAVAAEAYRRHRLMLDGVEAYRRHSYRRPLAEPPVVWSEGTTRLLDYRRPGAEGVPLLVVPSLVNRGYILDLTPRRSLVRSLAGKGLAPLMVDWGAPGETEAGFTLTDYVAGRLERALDAALELTGGRPVAVLGYCMGGLLALALAQRRPEHVASLALLATPWDFASGRDAHAAMMQAMAAPLGAMLDAMGGAPADFLNAMFASLDPGLAARKFTAFARLPGASARARDFVALEDWANDSVALAGPVARECLLGWYGDNDPALGRWRIAGRPVVPEEVAQPALVLVPEKDRIVPPASALPLAERLPNGRLVRMKGGHVGMLIAPRATTEVYAPIARWLHRSATIRRVARP